MASTFRFGVYAHILFALLSILSLSSSVLKELDDLRARQNNIPLPRLSVYDHFAYVCMRVCVRKNKQIKIDKINK